MRAHRRNLLKLAGALPVAASVPMAARASVQAETSGAAFELQRRHFTPLLGQSFKVTNLTDNVPPKSIKLVALDDVACCTQPDRSFRLVFESSGDVMQNLWQFSHPVLGAHAIFISPNDATGREIEAIFNRG